MKVFFDECVPRPLKALLGGHEVRTAQELGWGRLQNGELLQRAEQEAFQIFVTSDKKFVVSAKSCGPTHCGFDLVDQLLAGLAAECFSGGRCAERGSAGRLPGAVSSRVVTRSGFSPRACPDWLNL